MFLAQSLTILSHEPVACTFALQSMYDTIFANNFNFFEPQSQCLRQ